MSRGPLTGTTRGWIGLSCAAMLRIGAAAAGWADGTAPQTEVYDGLANTAFSSEYMNRANYRGIVNSIGSCDVATLAIGAGAAGECASSSALFTLFGRYVQYSAARPLDMRPFAGFTLSIR